MCMTQLAFNLSSDSSMPFVILACVLDAAFCLLICYLGVQLLTDLGLYPDTTSGLRSSTSPSGFCGPWSVSWTVPPSDLVPHHPASDDLQQDLISCLCSCLLIRCYHVPGSYLVVHSHLSQQQVLPPTSALVSLCVFTSHATTHRGVGQDVQKKPFFRSSPPCTWHPMKLCCLYCNTYKTCLKTYHIHK